jgi:putative oxidoreductase
MGSVEETMTETANIQRPTSNVQLTETRKSSGVVWRIVAVIIGGLFIYAGVVKVVDPVGFAGDIDNYKTLPWPVGVRLAFYLPWLEILCGLALITRVLYRGGVFILTLLMSVFIVATIVAKMRGLDISCGCFGHASQYLSFAWHLALDFLLLGGLLFLWRTPLPNSDRGDGAAA